MPPRYEPESAEQLLRELAIVSNLAANNLSFEHLDSPACQAMFRTFDSHYIPRSAEYYATVGLDDPYRRVVALCRALFNHGEFGAIMYGRVSCVASFFLFFVRSVSLAGGH